MSNTSDTAPSEQKLLEDGWIKIDLQSVSSRTGDKRLRIPANSVSGLALMAHGLGCTSATIEGNGGGDSSAVEVTSVENSGSPEYTVSMGGRDNRYATVAVDIPVGAGDKLQLYMECYTHPREVDRGPGAVFGWLMQETFWESVDGMLSDWANNSGGRGNWELDVRRVGGTLWFHSKLVWEYLGHRNELDHVEGVSFTGVDCSQEITDV